PDQAATVPSATRVSDADTHHKSTQSTPVRLKINRPKPIPAIARSSGETTAVLITGSYSAAASRPTTAALMPASALAAAGRRVIRFQSGSTPAASSRPGRNIARSATTAPTVLELANSRRAPRNAASENIGPGTACAAPYPAKKSLALTQSGR